MDGRLDRDDVSRRRVSSCLSLFSSFLRLSSCASAVFTSAAAASSSSSSSLSSWPSSTITSSSTPSACCAQRPLFSSRAPVLLFAVIRLLPRENKRLLASMNDSGMADCLQRSRRPLSVTMIDYSLFNVTRTQRVVRAARIGTSAFFFERVLAPERSPEHPAAHDSRAQLRSFLRKLNPETGSAAGRFGCLTLVIRR